MDDDTAKKILGWIESSLISLIKNPSKSNIVQFIGYARKIELEIHEAFNKAIKPEYKDKLEKIMEAIMLVGKQE